MWHKYNVNAADIMMTWFTLYTNHSDVTEVWHMAHFWMSYGRCTMPGSPMRHSEGLSRRWAG